MDEALFNLLAALVEQARALAVRTAGDAEHPTPCHFCGATLPLWEHLLVLQLTGVPAHARCPAAILEARLRDSGPHSEFPYEDFSRRIEERVRAKATPTTVAGEVDC
ncbi:MAG: hypothetical protein H6707_01965 [Deltaproteobacteria bacterium]|nr:hypothetical protein [Deltaproteobacteria bacterium]